MVYKTSFGSKLDKSKVIWTTLEQLIIYSIYIQNIAWIAKWILESIFYKWMHLNFTFIRIKSLLQQNLGTSRSVIDFMLTIVMCVNTVTDK